MRKTFTCRELGGVCDEKFSGSTVMEIVQKGMPHMMLDDTHKNAIMNMEKNTGENKEAWLARIQKEFDTKPEDDPEIRSPKWVHTPTRISNTATAALLSLLLNAPFAIGELLTRDASLPRTSFPFPLFIALWIEMSLFIYLLLPLIQVLRNGAANKKPILLAIHVLVLGILVWAWGTLIIDQWPCFFLGGNGC